MFRFAMLLPLWLVTFSTNLSSQTNNDAPLSDWETAYRPPRVSEPKNGVPGARRNGLWKAKLTQANLAPISEFRFKVNSPSKLIEIPNKAGKIQSVLYVLAGDKKYYPTAVFNSASNALELPDELIDLDFKYPSPSEQKKGVEVTLSIKDLMNDIKVERLPLPVLSKTELGALKDSPYSGEESSYEGMALDQERYAALTSESPEFEDQRLANLYRFFSVQLSQKYSAIPKKEGAAAQVIQFDWARIKSLATVKHPVGKIAVASNSFPTTDLYSETYKSKDHSEFVIGYSLDGKQHFMDFSIPEPPVDGSEFDSWASKQGLRFLEALRESAGESTATILPNVDLKPYATPGASGIEGTESPSIKKQRTQPTGRNKNQYGDPND